VCVCIYIYIYIYTYMHIYIYAAVACLQEMLRWRRPLLQYSGSPLALVIFCDFLGVGYVLERILVEELHLFGGVDSISSLLPH